MAEKKQTQMGTTGPSATGSQAAVPGPTSSQAAIPTTAFTPVTSPPAGSASEPPIEPPIGPLTGPGKHATSYLPPSDDPLVGQTLAGRYVIAKKLGEGGMGAVYLATHNLLEKQVALKILHTEFARKSDLVERFIQEAKAASRIRHENVIDISDFGSTPDGVVFFAMELLKGHDLHEEVARARLAGELLPWPRTKRIFLQICAALTAAHDKGIIHRDLKPENIYLVNFLGEPDFVKLLDFGIAKLTEVVEGERKLTRTGMLFGTPEYMSPEQARGDTVDVRVDVYAMGCILFQLCTGRVPFEAENFMGVLSLHLTEPPPSIPLEVFDRIGAPRELAVIIEKALSKDRALRWQTIAEFANAIRTACGDAIPSSTMSVAMASVPAPSSTFTRSSGTGQVAVPSTTPAPVTQPRIKTQWTGSLQVLPEPEDGATPKKSKLPLILGGVALVIGAAVAVALVMKGDNKATSNPEVGSGSNPVAVVVPADAAVAVVPPDAPPPPAAILLPEKAEIHLDSIPHGAEVYDVTNKNSPGKTPLGFKVPGSSASRQFVLRMKGYSDMVIELVPNRALIEYSEKLIKGAAGTTVVKRLPAVGSGSAVTVPDAGSATVKPDVGSAAKPPDVGSAAKPSDVGSAKPPDPKPDCPPEEFPCLKEMPKEAPKPPAPAPTP